MRNPEMVLSRAGSGHDVVALSGPRAAASGTTLMGVALRHALDDALAQVDRLVLCCQDGPASVSPEGLRLLQTLLWQVQDLAASVSAGLEAGAGGSA